MFSKTLLALLIAALVVGASGCASYDTRVLSYEPLIENNPAPNAIVGLWHTKPGSTLETTYLFKANGTVFAKGHDPKNLEATAYYQYRYAGGGVWEMSVAPHSFKLKLAKDHLLVYSPQGSAVFERH